MTTTISTNEIKPQLLWASTAEGERFASKIREMQTLIENIAHEEIERAKVFANALGGN